MGKTTTGAQPKKVVGICVVNQSIRNHFKEIVNEVLAEQKKVLTNRQVDLTIWGEKEKDEFLKIFGVNETRAKKWIEEGIARMLVVNGRVSYDDFHYKDDECVFANVNDVIDINNKIVVGPKFLNASLRGHNPRVSALCHEFSHLGEVMHTRDISLPGKTEKNTSADEYEQYAKNLVMNHSRDVMNNAYNIERYFE